MRIIAGFTAYALLVASSNAFVPIRTVSSLTKKNTILSKKSNLVESTPNYFIFSSMSIIGYIFLSQQLELDALKSSLSAMGMEVESRLDATIVGAYVVASLCTVISGSIKTLDEKEDVSKFVAISSLSFLAFVNQETVLSAIKAIIFAPETPWVVGTLFCSLIASAGYIVDVLVYLDKKKELQESKMEK